MYSKKLRQNKMCVFEDRIGICHLCGDFIESNAYGSILYKERYVCVFM